MHGTHWEKSKALTPLKHDLLSSFFRRSKDFFLTGGSALGIFYFDHRMSYDLDLFSVQNIDWHVLSNEIICIGEEIGADITQISAVPTFRRYDIRRGEEHEMVDFVREMVPQVSPQKNRFDEIIVDTLEEIAANKWCTLLGRSELKDLVDLYYLSKEIDIWTAFEQAKTKDGGMDPSMVSHLISQIKIEELPEYLLVPLKIADLQTFKIEICTELDSRSFPETDNE